MKVALVIIGDEILLGQVADTNSAYINRAVAHEGGEVVSVATVGDVAADIAGAVSRGLATADAVITSGGLGPTKDDVTKHVLHELFGGEMREDPEVLRNIHEVFRRRGLQMNALTAAQAQVPSSCRVIENVVGTAPIMWFERDGKVVVTLPGVPFEMKHMLDSAVLPQLCQRFGVVAPQHYYMVVAGVTESDLAQRLAPFEESLPPSAHVAYLPQQGWLKLRLDGADEAAFRRLCDIIGDNLLGIGDVTPAELLLKALRERRMMMGTAESCTGGNIAHTLTLIPGSSDAFFGGVVAYNNEVKTNILGVDADTLAAHGAVSIPVVRQMAEGVRRRMGIDLAVATSGIAGPGGGTPDKPVGTVCIAIATADETIADTLHLPGNRERVITRATAEVIVRALRIVKG